MTRHRSVQFVLTLMTATILARPLCAAVLVESVPKPWEAVQSGIQAHDRLLGWERQVKGTTVARGTFRDPWDVRDFELEQLARGPCRIRLMRDGRTIVVVVRSPAWGVQTGLLLSDASQQARFERGLARALAYDIEGARTLWRPLADELTSGRRTRATTWLLCRIGKMLIEPVAFGADRWPMEWVEGKGVNDADVLFAEAARIAHRAGDSALEAMVFEAGGRAWGEDNPAVPAPMSFGRCRKQFIQAVALRQRIAPDSLSLAASLHSLGVLWWYNDDGGTTSFDGTPPVAPNAVLGRKLCRQALALYVRHAAGTVAEANARTSLEQIERTANWWDKGAIVRQPTVAEKLARVDSVATTLRLQQRYHAPLETVAATALNAVGAAMSIDDFVGVVRFRRIEIALSEQLEQLELAGQRKKPAVCAPCPDFFDDLNNFSVELSVLGLADEAEAAALRSLEVAARRGQAPGAWTYDNLALAAGLKGDRASQQRYLLRSLELRKQEGRPELMVGIYLELGRAAGDETAATLARQALAISDTMKPGDEGERAELRNQQCSALVLLAERRQASAPELAKLDSQCASWGEVRANASVSDAYDLVALSRVWMARGDTARAVTLARSAVRVCRQGSAQTRLPFALGDALLHLGRAQCAAGDHLHGIASLEEARRVLDRIAPRSNEYLETLQALGACQRAGGRPEQGAVVLERALALANSLPSERMAMNRAFDPAKRAATSKELAGALADIGRDRSAFEALERGRAAVYRATLAGRGLTASPVPDEMAARRAQLWLKYDLTQKALQALPASATPAEVNGLQSDLSIVSGQLDGIAAEIAKMAPASQSANALTLDHVVRALPPGTVLVEFSVEADRTRLFLADPRTTATPLVVRTLPVTEATLSSEVAMFRRSLERRGTSSVPKARELGKQLYDQLLGPIDAAIAGASRLLVVADGPLFDLPFAALVRTSEGHSRYLVELLPVSVAVSASESVLVPQRSRQVSKRPVIAVGDVVPATTGDPRLAGGGILRGDPDAAEESSDPEESDDEPADERAGGRTALPGSRREVESIARLLAPDVTTLLGAEASESRVKSVASTARILHFATHAVTNSVFPLNTGLLLSPADAQTSGGRATSPPDNGFLQAWEVIGQMRLDADLVTLSACESARGRALAGEGALSLARAFQYAGARSVVSALWSIDDAATADLMSAFYAGLKDGLAKDEALRRAQLSFIGGAGKSERWTAPAYWAAFELSGDFR